MKLTLTPQRNKPLTLTKAGDVLTFNGRALDLSAIPPGGVLYDDGYDCPWIVGNIERDEAGELHLTVIRPYGNPPPADVRDPTPVVLDVQADGPVTLPPYTAPVDPNEPVAAKAATKADSE